MPGEQSPEDLRMEKLFPTALSMFRMRRPEDVLTDEATEDFRDFIWALRKAHDGQLIGEYVQIIYIADTPEELNSKSNTKWIGIDTHFVITGNRIRPTRLEHVQPKHNEELEQIPGYENAIFHVIQMSDFDWDKVEAVHELANQPRISDTNT